MRHGVWSKVDPSPFQAPYGVPGHWCESSRCGAGKFDLCLPPQFLDTMEPIVLGCVLATYIEIPPDLSPALRVVPTILHLSSDDVCFELAPLRSFEDEHEAVPPKPDLPIKKASGDEERDRAIELGKDGSGNLGVIEIAVIKCEGHRLLQRLTFEKPPE